MATSASGAESGWYTGLSAGGLSTDVSGAALERSRDSLYFIKGITAVTGTGSISESDATWSVLGGYRFSRYLALEAAYVDLGEISHRYSGQVRLGSFPPRSPPAPSSSLFPVTSEMAWDAAALAVKIVAHLPIGQRFDVHAQFGMTSTRTEFSSSSAVAQTPAQHLAFEDHIQTTNPVYGSGAAIHLGGRWSLSIDWQRYEVSDDAETPVDFSVNYDAVTLTMRFGPGAAGRAAL